MAHRSQCSSVGDNPLDPNYLPPHYREEYRLAVDALVENDLEGYYAFLQSANVVEFLSRPEIEHIKNTLRLPQSAASLPELPYREVDDEGSSDTYWPLHSDLDAPGLDLGWPMQQHSFIGPTEVTTLVNPSDPEMPSIKEQARRLIKNAQQVIAVVMDMFTDVDIFSDLLDAAARRVPVYILLDEQNAHHFVSMVTSCKVNLDMCHMMRVRTVAGITYFCRTGKSFKGQVMDRFLLADCRAVLSGNYSFMWSFEKIHRCIAHLFLGELVTTFDEEFRILFAQSQPLVVENALVPVPPDGTSTYLNSQFGLKRSQSLRNPRGYIRQPEHLAYQFGDRLDTALPFRRDDPFRHTIEPGNTGLQVSKFSSQFRMQQSFLEQSRPTIASRLEMNSYKRHSYAEGTHESYSSSRQYMKQRVMNNLEEMEVQYQRDHQYYQGEGMDIRHGRFEHRELRSTGLHQLEHYSDPTYVPELEALESQNILSSEDLSHNPDKKHHHGGAQYGQPSQKRPTLGQAYACQNSPTQLHPPDQKQMFPSEEQGRLSEDPNVKQGLRSWRINSYLSTYENAGEEGLQQPVGTDAFEETQPDAPGVHFNVQEPPNVQSKPKLNIRPRYGKPVIPDRSLEKNIKIENESTGKTFPMNILSNPALTSAEQQSEKDPDSVDSKDSKEFAITKHESFRSRVNPILQRSSRLRSSLIFSSSKVEQHSSTKAPEEEENKPVRTTSIIAEILEKRRSYSREPFDWSLHKKTDEKDNKGLVQGEVTSKPEDNSARDTKDITEEPKDPEKKDMQIEPSMPNVKKDLGSRLQYFEELSRRRNSKTELSVIKSQEPQPKIAVISPSAATTVPTVSVTEEPMSTAAKTESAEKPAVLTAPSKSTEISEDKIHRPTSVLTESIDTTKKDTAKEPTKPLKPFPSPKFFKRDALKTFKGSNPRRTSCDEDILKDATDAEKSELKKSRSLSTSGMPYTEPKESLSLSRQGSNLSLNVTGSEGKDTKALDFLKKQTQRLKGILGPKGDKKNTISSTTEDKQMKTVPEAAEETSPSGKESRAELLSVSTTESSKTVSKPSQSRYQTSTSTALFSSNLRDDTKVILEQISANSQKNRQDLTKQTDEPGSVEKEKGSQDSNLDRDPVQRFHSKNRFGRTPVNPQERDTLLKRIESMRKEKKVYSRFEMGNNLG